MKIKYQKLDINFNILSLPSIVFLSLYICILFGGGSARGDSLSLIYLRPVAIISVAVYFINSCSNELRTIKTPLIFTLCFAVILFLQILPFPITYWKLMPGHEIFAAVDGSANDWRPSSISPDRTLNSLFSLIVPFSALLAARWFSKSKRLIANALITGGLFSGAMATMQLAMGVDSAPYLYRLTTHGAVGLFSNPNHQAAMLACLIPMIALWLAKLSRRSIQVDLVATVLVFFILILVIVTGSRSGLAISFFSLLCSFWLHDACSFGIGYKIRRRYRIFYILICIVAAAILILTIALGRNLAIIRLSELNVSNDLRVADFHIFLELAKNYFPFGSGGGTFDPAFRIIEPASIIKDTYVNHAHNELIETAITLGLPGLLMIIWFVGWLFVSMINVLIVPHRDRDGYAVLGGVLITIMLLASLTDYPLRTPLMGSFFAVACAWLSMGSVAAKDARKAERSYPDRRQALSKFQDDLEL